MERFTVGRYVKVVKVENKNRILFGDTKDFANWFAYIRPKKTIINSVGKIIRCSHYYNAFLVKFFFEFPRCRIVSECNYILFTDEIKSVERNEIGRYKRLEELFFARKLAEKL